MSPSFATASKEFRNSVVLLSEMDMRGTSMLLLACLWPDLGQAQWQWQSRSEPARVFAGAAREIPVSWHNPGSHSLAADLRWRLYQTSTSLAAPFDEQAWKHIELPAGQTIAETAAVNFPSVRAETTFLVQWLAETNRVLGTSEVLVYPTNLLAELALVFSPSNTLGVLDLDNLLKPSLRSNGVAFVDLGNRSLDEFSGTLAIVGPFPSHGSMRVGLAVSIRKLAQRGVAVVWFLPPPGPRDPLVPSFYVVPAGQAAVLVAQDSLVAGFADDPQAQLNLIQLCQRALNPAPWSLPNPVPQP